MEFLGSASPDQLLLCMAGPAIGAIFFVGILFFGFARRNKKQPATLDFQPRAARAGEFAPLTPPGNLFPSPPPAEPALGQDPIIYPSGNLAPETSTPSFASPAELDLNSDFLRSQVETEADMMNSSQSSYERKTGLSARLANRPQPAAPAAEAKQDIPDQAATSPAVKPASEPAKQPVPPEPVELLRLLRDPQSGQLMVEIAGRRYTKLAEIADKEIGQYILKLAAHLLAFTNGMIATDAGLKSLSAPKVGETPMPMVAPTPVSQLPGPAAGSGQSQPAMVQPSFSPQPASPVEAALLASIRAQSAAPPPPPQRRGLFGRPKPAPAEPLLPELNLAAQINDIVQARLRYSPLAPTTQLQITSDPGGGILINVNGLVYRG
ncbi:MAG TPA: hypothetical protein VEC93_24690, partial [Anaerolineae bacterium]|nr:hypothetical protein [Anaerolineae bacterium]